MRSENEILLWVLAGDTSPIVITCTSTVLVADSVPGTKLGLGLCRPRYHSDGTDVRCHEVVPEDWVEDKIECASYVEFGCEDRCSKVTKIEQANETAFGTHPLGQDEMMTVLILAPLSKICIVVLLESWIDVLIKGDKYHRRRMLEKRRHGNHCICWSRSAGERHQCGTVLSDFHKDGPPGFQNTVR